MYADITIKARCDNPAEVESILLGLNATYQGQDVQTDTYYESEYGKLKHRQGNIENVLIHYNRTRLEEAHQTEVLLYLKNPSAATVAAVCQGKRILGQVKKRRKIFFIDNVKFHLDQIQDLGTFVEIEAIDLEGSVGTEVLQQQCDYYKEMLQIQDEDIITSAYTDLLQIQKPVIPNA
ncbi:class IV adenylate cyclase [Pontibacter cellulosilyticus]|uniref:CYTH domain-containing protein n=1 Tax=Pontibacter cellulosilyticus TaxID=1720253 RepID=A0A923N3C1_9BACT|nr:CYTH domain-containing protein [Pontibacter cellulosilyticus]MBC5991399.1 CYTH domain-containing protein [Pontibacter cellulosilyticus]